MKQPTVFRHVVGKSSLREGITIHKDFEGWFASPQPGSKKEIALIYDGDKRTSVTLRRLNNKAKHVQMRYETTKHSQFREWLQVVFGASRDQTIGEILEFRKIADDEYALKPLTRDVIDGTNLRVCKSFYHGGAENIIPYLPIFQEVPQAIGEVSFQIGGSQAYYNKRIKERFVQRGWETDKPVIEDLNLRYDFRKGNVQIEAEFGNARSYYQDYLKFSIAFNQGLISLGGLVAPTADFATVLCEIGKQKAWRRGNREAGGKPTYSGMMTYEKAAREFQHVKFMLNMPIVVMGIDYKN